MNKTELLTQVALDLGIEEKSKTATTREAERVLTGVLGALFKGVKADGDVTVPGLGKLVAVDVEAKEGTAPNGTKWKKPAHKVIKLRLNDAGKALV